MVQQSGYDPNWAAVDVNEVPKIKVAPPGPKSRAIQRRSEQYMQGYSSQAQLFPVAFESGNGVILTDVDGNEYIDFSSGIYVTNWGHCHPKITEAVVEYTRKLQNCHDFNTEIKTRLAEALVQITPGDLNNVQLWCEGSKCVEAALNVARAVTGKHEFISFYNDMHGKTLGAQSLTVMTKVSGPRAAGSFRVPFGNCYHCSFKLKYPACGLHCVDFLQEAITELATNDVAAIVVEPIQGWGGSVIPPDDWLPKVRRLCDERGILLFVDEVLTCLGRTGKMFCVDHWDVVPDIMTLGKGLGNGFPVTAVVYSDKFKEQMKGLKASSSYGGNPMACTPPWVRRGRPGRRDARTRRGSGQFRSRKAQTGQRKARHCRRCPRQRMSARHGVGQRPRNPRTVRASREHGVPKGLRQRRFLDSGQAELADVAAVDYDQGPGRQGRGPDRGKHCGNRTGTRLRMSR